MRQLYFLCVLCDTKGGGVFMVAIGCSFEACLMSLTCKYEILENPMSTVGAPTLNRRRWQGVVGGAVGDVVVPCQVR